MKKRILFLLVLLILNLVNADDYFRERKDIQITHKISNINEFPDYVFFTNTFLSGNKDLYIITESSGRIRFQYLSTYLYAVKKEDYETVQKDISEGFRKSILNMTLPNSGRVITYVEGELWGSFLTNYTQSSGKIAKSDIRMSGHQREETDSDNVSKTFLYKIVSIKNPKLNMYNEKTIIEYENGSQEEITYPEPNFSESPVEGSEKQEQEQKQVQTQELEIECPDVGAMPCPQGTETEYLHDEKGCDAGLKCYKILSNGRKAEIKIMPQTANQRAVEKLGELDFSVRLREVTIKQKPDLLEIKPVYELTGNKQGRFLGIFKIQVKVSAEVDATETGEVINIKKPWWGFLVSGV